MVQIAQDRIADLFGLADAEGRGGESILADRYIVLARRIGMRYNVRMLPEYRELYCRRCSAYWVEGRTLRTRLRRGRRVQTCLHCGHQRRVHIRFRAVLPKEVDSTRGPAGRTGGSVLAEAPTGGDSDIHDGEEEDE
jgi:ribonuclease P protein subunit RPR2